MIKRVFTIILLAAMMLSRGLMAQQTVLLNESFDNIVSGVPTGWDNSQYNSTSRYRWQSANAGYNNTRCVMFNSAYASRSTHSALKTPLLNLSQPMILRFRYQNFGAGQLSVFISFDGGATYTTTLLSNLTTSSDSEWGEAECSLAAFQGQSNVRIVFYSVSNYNYTVGQRIDNVVVESQPTCRGPENIYVSDLTTSSATLNWNLSPDGDNPTFLQLSVTDPSGNIVLSNSSLPGTSISYPLVGLTANTIYSVVMRGDCNSSLSGFSTSETYQFTTSCNALNLPYTENFDHLSRMPDCTTSLNCSIDSTYRYGTSGHSLGMRTTVNVSSYIIFPLLNHSANDLDVSFAIRGEDDATNLMCQVGVVGDVTDIEGSFEPLYADSVVGTDWREVRMSTTLSSYTTSPTAVCLFLGSGADASAYVDNMEIRQANFCSYVSGFTVSDVQAHTARVTIADPSLSSWQVSFAPAGTSADSGTIISVSGRTDTLLSSLRDNHTYDIRVRRDCGTGFGYWSSARTIHTAVLPDTLPYSTGFEDADDNLGWARVDGYSASNLFTIGNDPNAVRSGSRALYMSVDGKYTYEKYSDTKTFIYRKLYIPAAMTHFRFMWKCTGGESSYDFARIMLVPDSVALIGGNGDYYSSVVFPSYTYAFDPPGSNRINLTSGDANGWNVYDADVDMTARPGCYKFVIMWNCDDSDGDDYPIAVDNLTITQSNCAKPTVTLTSVTSSGATLTVTSQSSAQYEIAVSSTPIDVFGTVTGDILHQITSGTAAISSLAANTLFYYTARTICSAGDTSLWADVQQASTACAPFSVPYSEDFESANSLTCWSSPNANSLTRTTSQFNQGSASARMGGLAVSPELNVDSLTQYMLTGYALTGNANTQFSVGVIVDPLDPSTYVDLGTVTLTQSGVWTEFTTYFALLSDPDYEDFRSARHSAIVCNGTDTICIDDLYLGETPSCPKPTEISLTDITSTSFRIAWTDNADSATQWIVCAVPSVAGQPTVTQTVTSNPATITGLNPITTYTVRISAVCSSADTSLWAYAGIVNTACAVVSAPYEESFDYQTDERTPSCWDISSSTASQSQQYVWGVYSYDGNRMIRLDNYETYRGLAAIVSPTIALSALHTFTLSYDYCHQADCGVLTTSVSTDGGATWSTLATHTGYSGSEDIPGTWTSVRHSLSAYSGDSILLRFSAQANYGYGAIFIDNIRVLQCRNCSDVSSLSVNAGGNSAMVFVHDTCAQHTQWQYVYGPAGFNVNDSTPVAVLSDTIRLTGLNVKTYYDVYVRAYCNGDEQSYWTHLNFRTTCADYPLPYSETFSTVPQSYTGAGMINDICWDDLGAGNDAYTYPNYIGTYLYSKTGSSLQLNSSTLQPLYLIMPSFGDVSSCRLSFDIQYEHATASGVVYAGYMTDPADASTFRTLLAAPRSTSFESYSVSCAMLPAGARLAFKYGDANSNHYYAWLSNVRVTALAVAPEIHDTICHNTPYIAHGFNIPSSQLSEGDNRFTRILAGNPDTVLVANVYVLPLIQTLSFDTLCDHQPLHWRGYTIDHPTSRAYTLPVLTSVQGCDSFVTLILTVVPTFVQQYDTICIGSSRTFFDRILTSSGIYTHYGFNIHGCPDTTILHLQVMNPGIADIHDDACQGQVYNNYGLHLYVYADTTIIVTTKTAQQCDSTAYIHLTYHEREQTDTFAAIYTGDTLLWHGMPYTATGEYKVNYKTIYGCDSVVTLHLHVKGVGVDNVQNIVMSIVPNPIDAGSTALVYGNFSDVSSVEIINSFGSTIAHFEPHSYPIEIPALPSAGVYYVRLTTSTGTVHVQKLIVR